MPLFYNCNYFYYNSKKTVLECNKVLTVHLTMSDFFLLICILHIKIIRMNFYYDDLNKHYFKNK